MFHDKFLLFIIMIISSLVLIATRNVKGLCCEYQVFVVWFCNPFIYLFVYLFIYLLLLLSTVIEVDTEN